MSWVQQYFTVSDYVVMKVDVEGAEFDIINALEARKALPLIDVFALECHSWSGNCTRAANSVKGAGVSLRFDYEKFVTDDYWKAAIASFRKGLNSSTCAFLNFTCDELTCRQRHARRNETVR